jgi:hypothetical protein
MGNIMSDINESIAADIDGYKEEDGIEYKAAAEMGLLDNPSVRDKSFETKQEDQ